MRLENVLKLINSTETKAWFDISHLMTFLVQPMNTKTGDFSTIPHLRLEYASFVISHWFRITLRVKMHFL